MSTPTIQIPKWKDFQHYKNRNPPWIKLHRQLLNKRGWRGLDPFAAKLLVEVWLVASESNSGNIELSTADLAWHLRYHETQVVDVARGLLDLAKLNLITLCDHDASNVLAACQQDARPEERERRVEGEDSVLSERAEIPPKIENPNALIAPAIRKHAWLDGEPPLSPDRRPWDMGRELSIAKVLLKQWSVDELVGGIESYREAHPQVRDDQQWSLSWVSSADDRWRMNHAVETWRRKAMDALASDPMVSDLTARLMGGMTNAA